MFWVLTSWLAFAELLSPEDVAAVAESLIPVRAKDFTGTGKSQGVAIAQNEPSMVRSGVRLSRRMISTVQREVSTAKEVSTAECSIS